MIRRADLRFAYRLAAKMGRLDVNGMLAQMSASDLARWEAYFLLEPWGADVDDHRSGVIASTIANCNRGKNTNPFTPGDFFPSRLPVQKEARPLDDEQVDAMLARMNVVDVPPPEEGN